jgi:hypothetical protein
VIRSTEEVERLEKLIGQLNGLHTELSLLAKKSPNDALNLFKMKLVNNVLERANALLVGRYAPFDDFSQFSEDSVPTNSDVTLVLAQYIEQVERFRSDNVVYASGWVYTVNGAASEIKARPPTRVGKPQPE